MKGDDGLRTANYLESRLLTQYRELDERGQKSVRTTTHALLRVQGGAPSPKPKRRRGISDADNLRNWARDMGRLARKGRR